VDVRPKRLTKFAKQFAETVDAKIRNFQTRSLQFFKLGSGQLRRVAKERACKRIDMQFLADSLDEVSGVSVDVVSDEVCRFRLSRTAPIAEVLERRFGGGITPDFFRSMRRRRPD